MLWRGHEFDELGERAEYDDEGHDQGKSVANIFRAETPDVYTDYDAG